jgi:hypothetical protein
METSRDISKLSHGKIAHSKGRPRVAGWLEPAAGVLPSRMEGRSAVPDGETARRWRVPFLRGLYAGGLGARQRQPEVKKVN